MTFNLQKILESKRAMRRDLAVRPLGEKLRMLDAMRERTLSLRHAGTQSADAVLREKPSPYGKTKKTG